MWNWYPLIDILSLSFVFFPIFLLPANNCVLNVPYELWTNNCVLNVPYDLWTNNCVLNVPYDLWTNNCVLNVPCGLWTIFASQGLRSAPLLSTLGRLSQNIVIPAYRPLADFWSSAHLHYITINQWERLYYYLFEVM